MQRPATAEIQDPEEDAMRSRRIFILLILTPLLGGTLGSVVSWAQAPIKIGEINSYSGIGAPFTGPYRAGVEMAVDELNAKGGVLGKKLEVLFRDDKGQPAEAVKHAQELVESEKVAVIAGTFLSNVGLAVSDWAKQNKVMFVAAEPLTEALTWAKGHDHVVRLRPNTYEQGRMLADKAGKMKYQKWATIGPNYEYGKRAWETFRDRLKELKPDVQVVGEHWPTLGKIEPGPMVSAILNQNPEALYVSLFGSDWLAFVREAQKRGLFQKTYVVGILLGEPEYIDPLKLEAPEGMLVTGYPWYDISTPAHKDFVARYTKRTDKNPVLGSLIGYSTYLAIAESLRKAGSTDPDKIVAAFKALKVETPVGPITFRASDGQSTLGAWVGTTKVDQKRGVGIMTNWEYVPGEKVLPSDDEVKKLRPAS
jgi:branched-chain amino acid transport system substrate-binding protein